ncbi:MAG: hypothetical protein ACLQLC_10170 [Candidatus Sulfotelmatobacter sp.]
MFADSRVQIMNDSFSNSTPQFSTVEYAKPHNDRCQFCQQPTGATYYRVNGALACPRCAEKMRSELAVDHSAFARALAFGIGAAVVGLIGYALIAILLQGWVISYMSIGVGWIVGTAMMKGSNGVGGKRYQIVAALLTYAAVSMAAIPIWIHFVHQEVTLSLVMDRLGRLMFLGLASPFTELSGNPFWGLMGLLILFFGMRIAWRMTAGRELGVSGPFAYAPPA